MKASKKPQSGYLLKTDFQFDNGFLAHQKGLLKEAEGWYRKALQAKPKHPAALHLLGIVYAQWGHYAEAVTFIAKAAALTPNDFSVQNNLGNALIKLGKDQPALEALDKALSIKPDSAEVWNNRGNALFGLGNFVAALESYDKSLLLRENYSEALCNKANALIKLARYDEALVAVEQSLLLDSTKPVTLNTKGNVMFGTNQLDAAFKCYDEALLLRPEYALPHYGRGLCFAKLNRTDDAIREFELSVALDPGFVDVYPELATVLFTAKRFDDALAISEKAIALNSKRENILGARTLIKTRVCNWTDLNLQVAELLTSIKDGELAAQPLHVLSISDDLALNRQAAQVHLKNRFPLSSETFAISKKLKKYRIKIAYYSADFHDHATMRLMAEFFELHDRKRFEIFAFSFGPVTDDFMRQRAVAAFDRFIEVIDKSDAEVAAMSREMGIDIAVDLKGLTGDCRVGIFAARAAPIQLNYLGYPGTMGADYFDYILADAVLIPDHLREFYSEKVVQLPHTCQVNDCTRPLPDMTANRATYGLPDKGFIFCNFNNNSKIMPEVFDVWMKILQRVPGSVLWLLSDNPKAEENLKHEAAKRGIAAERLVFAPRVAYAENLTGQALADLCLDTFPYNAHSTASDALWAGVPLLTLQGQSFAARVASSLLHAVGLPELVTTNLNDYEELAVGLAAAPDRLAAIKSKLLEAKQSAPLFDTPLLTRDIETAYRAMFERRQAGLPPDHLVL